MIARLLPRQPVPAQPEPVQEEAVEEDDVEEEVTDPQFKSKQRCQGCYEAILYTDEIFALSVVEAAQENGEINCQALLCDDGDYQFAPLLMHLACWEEVLETIRSNVDDSPPVESPTGILICSCCESTIGSFEPFVSATFGEVHVSQRCPSGQPSETISLLGGMRPVCMACMVYVIEDYFDEWEDLFYEYNITYEEDT